MTAEKSVVRIREMEVQPSTKSLTHRSSILKESALLRVSRTKLTGSSRIFDDKPWLSKKSHQAQEEYEPTYKMKPDKLLNISAIERVAADVLQKVKNDKYAVDSCRQSSKTLSHLLLQKVKELGFPRYKFVCLVTIGSIDGQGMRVASRCLWDHETDSYASATFKNSSLYAIATVYGIYYE